MVFVDELDRCSPKFAINFLEKIKHYFDMEEVAFVLMINKDQIYKSISGFYGQDIDGAAYLEKFLSLPVIDLPSHHLQSHRHSSNVKERASYKYYKKLLSERFQNLTLPDNFISLLSVFSEILELNYREHEQALLLVNFYPKKFDLKELDSYFIIMKIKDPSILKGIFEGHKSAHQKALSYISDIEEKIRKFGLEPDSLEIRSTISKAGLMSFCQAIHNTLSTSSEGVIKDNIEYIKNFGEFSLIAGPDQLEKIISTRIEPLIY